MTATKLRAALDRAGKFRDIVAKKIRPAKAKKAKEQKSMRSRLVEARAAYRRTVREAEEKAAAVALDLADAESVYCCDDDEEHDLDARAERWTEESWTKWLKDQSDKKGKAIAAEMRIAAKYAGVPVARYLRNLHEQAERERRYAVGIRELAESNAKLKQDLNVERVQTNRRLADLEARVSALKDQVIDFGRRAFGEKP